MYKELTAHHREIARLKFEGLSANEIAMRTHTTVAGVRNILNDPLCQAHIANLSLRADNATLYTRKKMAELQCQAIDRIADILEHPSQNDNNVGWKTIASTAMSVLDRNGHAPSQQINHTHSFFTLDDIKELRERAVSHGAVLDVSFEQVESSVEVMN